VLAFSGQGPSAVHVVTVKGFAETARGAAWPRIAALEPDGYTRAGAAIRHASALLGAERARHRLLLVISDGKPNDVDEYAGRYGIEDTRQAVAEARLQGLQAFCLTVDREAPAYLPRVFGPRGFAVLPRPERLPAVLVEMLRSLVAA
jgi:nitric oxide reductase NorD protein